MESLRTWDEGFLPDRTRKAVVGSERPKQSKNRRESRVREGQETKGRLRTA